MVMMLGYVFGVVEVFVVVVGDVDVVCVVVFDVDVLFVVYLLRRMISVIIIF